MKSKSHLVGIRLSLLVSVLFGTLAPLPVRAASNIQANNPPYVIRGHVYEYGTTVGLAGAQVQIRFEACDSGAPEVRSVWLPLTDASGSWEFDERDYEQAGGLGCPCPGTSFTIQQQNLPTGYIAVRTQTPSRLTDAEEMLPSRHPHNAPHTAAGGLAFIIRDLQSIRR